MCIYIYIYRYMYGKVFGGQSKPSRLRVRCGSSRATAINRNTSSSSSSSNETNDNNTNSVNNCLT